LATLLESAQSSEPIHTPSVTTTVQTAQKKLAEQVTAQRIADAQKEADAHKAADAQKIAETRKAAELQKAIEAQKVAEAQKAAPEVRKKPDAQQKNAESKADGKKQKNAAPPEPVAPEKAAKPDEAPAAEWRPAKVPFEAPALGIGPLKSGSFWANLPVLPKVAAVLVLAAAIGGGVYFSTKTPASTTGAASGPKAKTVREGADMMINVPGGWSPDWGGEINHRKNRTISFYRPSANRDDYRIEFEGEVKYRGLGWVFRAVDPKNYLAYKVEFVKLGAEPGVALTHFAVIDGMEGQKHYTPLAKPIHLNGAFRVRLDVRGGEFSAYINDELVEVWTEDRLPKGGFGLMTEGEEQNQVRKIRLFELLQ
jgi:hypothetical protein